MREPGEGPNRCWWSAHLHFEGGLYGATGDRVIRRVVAPLVRTHRERMAGWFFIRYSLGGNHVRLRLRGDLVESWAPAAVAVAASGLVQRVEPAVYEPEVERYGGGAGVAAAEDLFEVSSQAALDLLATLPKADRSARLGVGLAATLCGLQTFVDGAAEAAALIGNHGARYLRYRVPETERQRSVEERFSHGLERQARSLARLVASIWEVLAEGGELPPPLALWRRGLEAQRGRLRELVAQRRLLASDGRPVRRWESAVGGLLPSYLHMMSNRLGITVGEEIYLAWLISEVLAAPAGRAVAARARGGAA